MGISGISIWQLLIILAIALLVFGSKRLGSLGADLGAAVRGFRKGLADDSQSSDLPRPGTGDQNGPGPGG